MDCGKIELDSHYAHYASEVAEDSPAELSAFYERVRAWKNRYGIVLGESVVAIEEHPHTTPFPLTYVIRASLLSSATTECDAFFLGTQAEALSLSA